MGEKPKKYGKSGGKKSSPSDSSETIRDGNRRVGVEMKLHYISYPMEQSVFDLGVAVT